MAMLPFCGYDMGSYFAHWLSMGKRLTRPPRIFHVNWFRTDSQGRFLWPGFGDNIRVLDWILRRVEGSGAARTTPIGYVPTRDTIDVSGLDLDAQRVDALTAVDAGAWLEEAARNQAFLDGFGKRLPEPIRREHLALIERLNTHRN
jgi:phosphoenolpyruvate carboxykinase (GTP)